ncbi:MAG: YerC/YecD family TrpR-related protein [Bacillota bacterium]
MYKSKFANEEIDFLFDAVLSLKDKEECYKFFEDLCTVVELHSLAMRLDVSKRLLENQTYQAISDANGASPATISRINRCLQYGTGGYKLGIDNLKGE